MIPTSKVVSSVNPTNFNQIFHIGDFQVYLFTRIADVPDIWDEISTHTDFLLSKKYLEILEIDQNPDFSFYYLLFYQKETPKGIVYCQEIDFRFTQSVNFIKKEYPGRNSLQKRIQRFWARFGDLFPITPLICGSAFLTGDHGFIFKKEIKELEQFQLVATAMQYLIQKKWSKGKMILIKDLPDHLFTMPIAQKKEFTALTFQPAMKLQINPNWHDFNDYLNAMSSKYRTRAKSAQKKALPLSQKELSTNFILSNSTKLYHLYREIADRAAFNLAHLTESYFAQLKQRFPDQFKVFGYFDQEELVGFCTTFHNHDTMEAHFLGFKAAYNKKHKIYLNMLYRMIEEGILSKAPIINFSRTALEIKSSVGATPFNYNSFVKHRNPVLNWVLPIITNNFGPKEEWVPRNPFK